MLGAFLSGHLKRGNLSRIGRPLYEAVIKTELAYIRKKDGNRPFENTPLVDAKLTAVIKTFERPDTLNRLVDSIKRLYPNLHIIVVDDSRIPSELTGVETIVMPYDSGVSAGRNRALAAVKTPYLLLLDDDYVFYRGTDLEPAMRIMETQPAIDVMGGERIDLPSCKPADYGKFVYPSSDNDGGEIVQKGTVIAGFPVYDKVANFYIARMERVKRVGWDDRLKRLDHADFFIRAKGTLVTVFNKNFKVLHAQTPFNEVYMQKRRDVEEDRRLLVQKHR